MIEKTITLLNVDELRVLKHIIIISDRQQGEIELGRIIYTRPLTEDYNLKKQQEEDDKSGNSFDKFFQEYPKQKNYPEDRIDEIIFEAVKKVYPKSTVKNDTILFNVDLEKIKILKNRNTINAAFYFSPEFSNVVNLYEYVGKEFKATQININIYSYYIPEFLEGQIFYANYNFNEKKIIDDLKTVRFE